MDIRSDEPMKWTKMKRRERRRIDPNEGVYARPHARAVRRRKKERRWVNEGSGRCHVFFVSVRVQYLERVQLLSRIVSTYVSIDSHC